MNKSTSNHPTSQPEKRNFWLTPNGLAALGLIGAVTYFLLSEHRAHFIYALPYLILLLCPFMHFFMHRGHGGHDGHGGDGENPGHGGHNGGGSGSAAGRQSEQQ